MIARSTTQTTLQANIAIAKSGTKIITQKENVILKHRNKFIERGSTSPLFFIHLKYYKHFRNIFDKVAAIFKQLYESFF
jgi:hypothetical protein